jgi:cytochrome b561
MLKNSPESYGAVSKTLHWSLALLIIGLIWLGWYMVDLTYYDTWYNDSLSLHKSLGMLVLVLALVKLAWVSYSKLPDYSPTLKPWERAAARITHAILFFVMFAIPITGYFISTSAGDPISIFGWFDIPALFPVGEAPRDIAIELHYYLAYATAGLVALHALAALKHQFVDRDNALGKML